MGAEIIPFNKAATALPWQAAPVEDIVLLFGPMMPQAYDREAGGRVVEALRERCDLAAQYETFCTLSGPRPQTPAQAAALNARFLHELADTVVAPMFTAMDQTQDPLAFYCKNFGKYLHACANALDIWRLDHSHTPYTARSIAHQGYDAAFPRMSDYDHFLFVV